MPLGWDGMEGSGTSGDDGDCWLWIWIARVKFRTYIHLVSKSLGQGKARCSRIGMCVLKDPGAAAAAAAGLLTRADRWQPAENGWGELSDSRCSVILRCGSVCAQEYASTIYLAFGRSSSYCSAGRKERVARSKHAPSLTYSRVKAPAVCSWRGASRKASLVLGTETDCCSSCHRRLCFASAAICVASPLHGMRRPFEEPHK
jgi:hypothetical protein